MFGSASCAPKEEVVVHAPPPPPPPAGSGTSMPVATSGDEAPPARSSAPDCGTDEVYEHICGVMNTFATAAPAPHDRCGTRGSDLESYGRSRVLGGFSMQAKDSKLASFGFDAALTDTWAADYRKMTNGNTPWKAACCYSRCQRIDVVRADGIGVPPGRSARQTCIPAPVRTSMPSPLSQHCPAGARVQGPSGLEVAPLIAGSAEQCCYRTTMPTPTCNGGMVTPDGNCYQHPRGRPLRVGGAIVVADARARSDWADAGGEVGAEGDRAAAAEAWAREAAAEHASVAAFSRLSLQLLAFGAPPELLRACHVAALEEVEHARAAYAIASSLAGGPVGPGPLDVARASGLGSLEELVRETIADGCVGESAAALEAEQARGVVADARIRAALEIVARDEAAHAELAFRVVAWAIDVGGEGAALAAREALASVERSAIEPAPADGPDLSAFGLVSAADARAIRAAVVREVAAPCLRAMLDARRELAVAPSLEG